MRFIFFIIAIFLYSSPMIAQADDSRNVNFIIFEKSTASFQFDPIMFGNFSQFIKSMTGAHLLLLSHSANSIDGDVLNLQQDVLRERQKDQFNDDGINCQLSFHYDNSVKDIEYMLSGNCQVIIELQGKALTLRAKIPATELPDAALGNDVWIEVYEDKRSGIAFYANVSKR